MREELHSLDSATCPSQNLIQSRCIWPPPGFCTFWIWFLQDISWIRKSNCIRTRWGLEVPGLAFALFKWRLLYFSLLSHLTSAFGDTPRTLKKELSSLCILTIIITSTSIVNILIISIVKSQNKKKIASVQPSERNWALSFLSSVTKGVHQSGQALIWTSDNCSSYTTYSKCPMLYIWLGGGYATVHNSKNIP